MSIFSHTFEDPESGDRATLLRYFNGYDYRAAGYTYITNYIWRRSYCLSWDIIEGYDFARPFLNAREDLTIWESSSVSWLFQRK